MIFKYYYCQKYPWVGCTWTITMEELCSEIAPSIKWEVKWSENHSGVFNSLQPVDYTVHGILQARVLELITFPFSWGFSQPGIEPRSPALQADSLPDEPQGKPKNTRVGSLPLLQGIFSTQESNGGLLHCRQILYQLSYEGSPHKMRKLMVYYNWEPGIIKFLITTSLILFDCLFKSRQSFCE